VTAKYNKNIWYKIPISKSNNITSRVSKAGGGLI